MKNYTQVYVMNSFEAVKMYCDAFCTEVSFAVENETKDAYEHCELSVKGEPILAVAEAGTPYDASLIHKLKWQTMTFNAFELGGFKDVEHAFLVLSQGVGKERILQKRKCIVRLFPLLRL